MFRLNKLVYIVCSTSLAEKKSASGFAILLGLCIYVSVCAETKYVHMHISLFPVFYYFPFLQQIFISLYFVFGVSVIQYTVGFSSECIAALH